MQTQIIRVDDIEAAIKENGLEYYVDRLIQDNLGDYRYIEVERYTTPELHPGIGWELYHATDGDVKYRVSVVPRPVAWFVVDALRIQSQLMCAGSTEYDDNGPHGGAVKAFIKDNDDWREVDHRVMVVEEL